MMTEMRGMIAAGQEEAAILDAEPCMDPPPAIGSDERRMHVRAYNYWASLLNGRTFPSIDELKPDEIGDFGPHGVLLDFTVDRDDPTIPWLGRALREEGGHGPDIRTLADVPHRSLLARLTDHFGDVVANRAPIGFEAEFENVRGNHALYRGILMPFTSDGVTIDYIYGVINWKEIASDGMVAGIVAEVARAAPPTPRTVMTTPVWADGPSRPPAAADLSPMSHRPPSAMDPMTAIREAVDLSRSTEARARLTLYRALGVIYDQMLADNPAEIRAGWTARDRRKRLRATIKAAFGPDEPRRHRIRYAAILSHGLRTGIGPGGLRMALERHPDGMRGMVATERAADYTARI